MTTSTMPTVYDTSFLNLRPFRKGKVRDMYKLPDGSILMIATDRLSAFDVVFPQPIPDKGRTLNRLSAFWFGQTKDIVRNHYLHEDVRKLPEPFRAHAAELEGRSMVVRDCRPVEIECVVRGYLAGSGWKEYRKTGIVSGHELPDGLRESSRLPEPIFTPAMKAHEGHDENITEKRMANIVGNSLFEKLKKLSLEIYGRACEMAEPRGIIVADTKFEFGLLGNEVVLIDEVLTPDSSRFWDVSKYKEGGSQESFDKQSLRDYVESIGWDKKPPAPQLPENVIKACTSRYREAYRRITGRELT